MTIELTPIHHPGFGEAPSTPHWEPHVWKPLMRDSQRRKVYRSEWAFNKAHPEEAGMDKTALRAYLNMVAQDAWFLDRFGRVLFTININRRRKVRASCMRRGVMYTLKFPELGGHNNRLLALHELCHALCYDQSHGPIYCSVLLQLVIHYMGIVCGKELRHQFNQHGVEFIVR